MLSVATLDVPLKSENGSSALDCARIDCVRLGEPVSTVCDKGPNIQTILLARSRMVVAVCNLKIQNFLMFRLRVRTS